MADETQIIEGSFKGVMFTIRSSSIDGGRKHSVKQFPSRNTQSVEDLGLLPRKYDLEIVLKSDNYFVNRDALLEAIESKELGELIHPFYGRVSNVKAVSYSLNESIGSFGDSTVSVKFEVDNSTGIPVTSGNIVTEINEANNIVQAAVLDDIANSFNVTPQFTGNFSAAVNKVNAVIDQANTATDFIGEASDNLNNFSAEIGELSSNVNSLVTNPLNLATSITGLFGSVNGLYSSAQATFNTVIGFFGFGDDDTPVKTDTFRRVERVNNNQVLNSAVNASMLSYSYLSAVQIDFQTEADIDNVASALDNQFAAVMDGNAAQEVKDSIISMRVKVLDAFDEARLTTSSIITIRTNPTTVRLLAFGYYGNDNEGQTIAELNDIADASFVEGNVDILTA